MRETFNVADLVLVTDGTPVEHVGGPDDGRFLPLCGNARRSGGFYVPLNVVEDGQHRVTAMVWSRA